MSASRCGRSISIKSDAVCKIRCRLSQMTNSTIPRPSRAELEIFERFNGTPVFLIKLLTMQRVEYSVDREPSNG